MPSRSVIGLAALLAFGGITPLAAAADKEPPSCAAIAFRPLPPGSADGVQSAGMYRSRFVRIDMKTNVTNGASQGYFVEIDGKPLVQVAAQDLPKDIAGCAQAKHYAAPGKPEEPCDGDRLTVLITHNKDKRYFLLYGHRGGNWHFCSAGTA